MYDVKYAPFADSYIGMAHGNGYEHLKHWLKRRLIFCDTLFDYAPSYNNDMLTIRANTTELMNIEIETYTPVYQHVSWYNGQMDKKKIDGKTAVSFSGTAMAETDQEVLIYGGSNIKKISGITSMNPNQMLIGSATRLSELSAPNCPLLADINSNKANLSPHTYLNKVDLSNCPQLGGILRLNNSQLVRDVNISRTAIDGLQLPTNVRNLETFKLSENVANVTLRDAVLLKELNIPTNIEYLLLINVPNLAKITSTATSFNRLNTLIMENPTINPISNITSKAPNLQYVRLTNLDIACSSAQIQSLLNMKGVDSFGNEIPLSQAVSGKVTLSQCSEDIEQALKEKLPLVEFTVTSYVKTYRVTFVDGDGNVIYETHALENGEAIYAGNTPTKTSTAQYDFEFKGWNRQLKPITSDVTITATFNSVLRYYTIRFINSDTLEVLSSQYLGYGSMPVKPSLYGTDFNAWNPAIIEVVTKDTDYYTQYIPYPDDISMFTFYKTKYNNVDGYACSLNTDITDISYLILPFEYNGLPVFMYSHNSSSRTASSVEEVYMPETIRVLGRDAFRNFTNLKSIDLSEITRFSDSHATINSINVSNVLYNCDSLTSISLPKLESLESPSYQSDGLCNGCQNLKYVYLGSSEYPITSFTGHYNGNTSYRHFYGANNLVFINLITENGLESDVEFTNMYNTIKEKIICSKAPIELYSDDNFDYMIIDNEGVITAYKGTATEIEIPSTVKNIPITKIGDGVFYNSSVRTEITSVTLPSTVTSLGYNCFRNCSNLTEINLQNVTSLGQYCFYYCIKLASIDLSSITSLGDYCFQNCSNLTEVTLPNTITSLSNYCFNNCTKLASINLSNVTSLGQHCFNNCTNLTSIDLPNTTSLGSYSFASCTSLTSINLPLVTTISAYCFQECYELTEVNAPNVTSLNSYCFYNSDLVSVDFPLVTTLGDNCFQSCTKLTSIDLPLATSLGARCFYGCSNLTEIVLPNVTTIAANGFAQSGFKIISLPKLTRVTQQCFADARKLETVIIGSKEHPVTYVYSDNRTGDSALTSGKLTPFYYCSALKKVVFVTANGSLSDITLSNGNYVGTKSNSFATSNIYNITTNSIFQFVTSTFFLTEDSNFKYEVVDDEATITAYKGTATEVEIPSTVKGATVTKIGDDVFYSSSVMAKITSVNLPSTVTSLGKYCFYNCSNLTEINLLNVSSMDVQCFCNCRNLTSINLSNVTSLGESCFYGCTGLTSIELPLATSLGNSCFNECSNLTSIELPLATSLGDRCFYNCTGLTSIELPSVTSIGQYCFYSCGSLGTVTLGGIGKPITDTSGFNTACFPSATTYLIIYVSDPSNPPTLTGRPWDAINSTITYEQA